MGFCFCSKRLCISVYPLWDAPWDSWAPVGSTAAMLFGGAELELQGLGAVGLLVIPQGQAT